ncbi:uncharacterized protein H6S33_008149 [Morchella sextelata]|uniref:uncharacterized protein n=1 Tax=Morchella sextelata TaxID=1174677 RepID=UPI001D050827|nr:uncharacterized protein H6S33_008149 [Morchella sextelata]KAH0603145.1 hypothetical protein H6S33_008149 [Morchella sextelata]
MPDKPRKTARREWPEGVLWQGIGMKRLGAPYSTITKILKLPKSTLANAMARYEKTGQVKSTPRHERPKITTVRDDRQLLICSRRERTITYEQLRQEFAVQISASTIKRRLATFGVHKHIMAERPKLTPYDARRRLRWCIAYRHWDIRRWRRVVWSDECSVEKYADPYVSWAFRTAKEKWLPECVKGVRKSGGVSKMM